jgi:hypothetical protein
MRLAHTPGDELRYLGAEIEDKDFLVLHKGMCANRVSSTRNAEGLALPVRWRCPFKGVAQRHDVRAAWGRAQSIR